MNNELQEQINIRQGKIDLIKLASSKYVGHYILHDDVLCMKVGSTTFDKYDTPILLGTTIRLDSEDFYTCEEDEIDVEDVVNGGKIITREEFENLVLCFGNKLIESM